MAERVPIALACEECQTRNYKTTVKPDRVGNIQLKKYCPACNRHTIHKETK